MQPKKVYSEDETRAAVLRGAQIVYEAVRATYSPQSGNVAIELNYGRPVVSHDGVTVARSISLTDPLENIGASYLKEASEQTNRVAGDGTSATVILGYHLIEKAHKLVAAGHNPMALRRGMERAALAVKDFITHKSKDLAEDNLYQVAAISAGDEAIGRLIADTLLEVGKNGGVNVEAYTGLNVEQDILEGFYWSEGIVSPFMVNNIDMRRAEYDGVWVLVTDKKIRDITDIKPVLEIVVEQDKPNLLIVGDVSGQALNYLMQQKIDGHVNSMAVQPMSLGNQRPEFLIDLATKTGATVIPEGYNIDQIEFDNLGYAERVISSQTHTTIYDGAGEAKEVKKRIKVLEQQLKATTDAGAVEKLEARLAKLNGKIGVIKVGGATESERKELMMRVEDAVFATRAARESGVVPGGGTTLLHASKIGIGTNGEFDDEMAGMQLVLRACQEPFRQLLHNAGLDDIGYERHAVLKKGFGWGYDVKQPDQIHNLFEKGIVDPTKVIVQVVENAVSVAGLAITTNAAVIIDKEELRKDAVLNYQ